VRVLVTCATDGCSAQVFGSGYCVVCEREPAAETQLLAVVCAVRPRRIVRQFVEMVGGAQQRAETGNRAPRR
jgi:Ni,Fe-hydrogenase III small subunit